MKMNLKLLRNAVNRFEVIERCQLMLIVMMNDAADLSQTINHVDVKEAIVARRVALVTICSIETKVNLMKHADV